MRFVFGNAQNLMKIPKMHYDNSQTVEMLKFQKTVTEK